MSTSLHDEAKRQYRDAMTYQTAYGVTDETTPEELAVLTAEDTVRSIMGNALMELCRINETTDSHRVALFIERESKAIGIKVGPNWSMTRKDEEPIQ